MSDPATPPISTASPLEAETELAPSYAIPLGFVTLALPGFLLQPWISGAIALFGLFLMIQALTLRLRFTAIALDVYRGSQRLRHFPYQDWQNWAIFWPPLPILFYFKEVKSIHFLPILFDPRQLRACLEHHCPRPHQAA